MFDQVSTDVPPPGELWAQGVVKAMMAPYLDDCSGRVLVDGGGLRTEDIGNGFWALRWVEGGRALLYGHDNEASDTHIQDLPVDLLAGGPEWLPWEWLRDLLVNEDYSVAFLRWWDSSWGGPPLPGHVDDGLAVILADGAESMDEYIDGDGSPSAAAYQDLLDAVTAGTVERPAVEALLAALDVPEADPAEALGVAAQAGVTPGERPAELPAGSGEPSGRWVPVFYHDHLRAVTAMAEREGIEIAEVPGAEPPTLKAPPRFCLNGADEPSGA
ncbi:hypothetical protein GWI34_28405 [Actinomadura sp. DSM 109109]|nr:hypothetical protein [Actinomadura lepetitiana]